MPVIPALRELRHEFQVSLGYVVRPCLKKRGEGRRSRGEGKEEVSTKLQNF
jgi:hypothetical protein